MRRLELYRVALLLAAACGGRTSDDPGAGQLSPDSCSAPRGASDCESVRSAHAEALLRAKACGSDADCSLAVQVGIQGCTCPLLLNPSAADALACMRALGERYGALGCLEPIPCVPCPAGGKSYCSEAGQCAVRY